MPKNTLPMKLGFSAPLPLWTTPTARLAAALLPELRRHGVRAALVENPFRVQPGLVPDQELHRLCDLPPMLQAGDLELPLYLVGDDPLCLNQLRYVRMCPGLLVLPGLELDALQQCLQVQVGDRRLPFLRGFDGHPSLAAVLAGMSRGVVVGGESQAEWLRQQVGPSVPVFVCRELHPDALDAAGAAARLADVAASLPTGRCLVPEDPGQWPPVTAVVIGYNSKDIVGPCLQTLLDQDYPNLEVTVVDNDSKDGTADFIRERFPTIHLIASAKNLGFAEGNNLVFRTSRSKYVVLLNQDAYAVRNWVTELVRVAELDESVGSVGSKMLMYRCPTILNSTAIEINEAGWGWDRQVGEKDDNPSPMPEEVFGGCGGAVLYRKAALDRVGGFDPAFFMYYEDTDLAWRLRLAGYRNYYAPMAVVRHDFHGDTGATPGRLFRRRFMSERNRWATLVKNADWSVLRRVLPRIRKYDKGRIQWLEKAVRDGHDPEFHGGIARMIKKAWRYNLVRLPSLWLRRRRTQRLRRAGPVDVERFIVKGINEGGHQGDVESFHDRFSATPRDAIRMGATDQGCLGSGWHTLENPPGAVQAYRWCKGRAFCYLHPAAGAREIVLKAASPIEPHRLRVWAESCTAGEVSVQQDVREYRFPLPDELPRGRLLEFTLECETLRPCDRGLGGDIRDLGAVIFEIRAE